MDTNAPKENEGPNIRNLRKRKRPSISLSKEILVYDLVEQYVSIRMAKEIDLNRCRQIPDLPRDNRFYLFIDAKNESGPHSKVFEVNLEKLSRRHHMLRFLGQLSTLYLMDEPEDEAWSSHTFISRSPLILVYDCAKRTVNVQSVKDTNLRVCQTLDIPPKQDTVPIFVDAETQSQVTTARTGAGGRCNFELATLHLDKLDRRDRKRRSRGQLPKLFVLNEVSKDEASSSHT